MNSIHIALECAIRKLNKSNNWWKRLCRVVINLKLVIEQHWFLEEAG